VIKFFVYPCGEVMYVSKVNYDKLWHILIDKKMSKKDLRLKSGVSTAVIAKLGKGASLTTEVLVKICDALNTTALT